MNVSASALARLHQAMRLPGQPGPFYAALEDILAAEIGFLFVTIFVIDSGETLRVYSTRPDCYPIGERKPMAATPWGDHVLRRHQTFLAGDAEAVERTFFDHERIAALGCAAVLSVPVVYDGRCLGVLNLNGVGDTYDDTHIAKAESVAPALAPVFMNAIEHMRDTERRQP